MREGPPPRPPAEGAKKREQNRLGWLKVLQHAAPSVCCAAARTTGTERNAVRLEMTRPPQPGTRRYRSKGAAGYQKRQ
eukprot:15434204-Alexandrium_andersonii.AAC.1